MRWITRTASRRSVGASRTVKFGDALQIEPIAGSTHARIGIAERDRRTAPYDRFFDANQKRV
jgi:hypothetical protein